jgi:hypothetical protein
MLHSAGDLEALGQRIGLAPLGRLASGESRVALGADCAHQRTDLAAGWAEKRIRETPQPGRIERARLVGQRRRLRC